MYKYRHRHSVALTQSRASRDRRRSTAMSISRFAAMRYAVQAAFVAWRQPCKEGVQRERLAHHFRRKCSVLHHYSAGNEKRIFSFPLVGACRCASEARRLQARCGVMVFLAVGNKPGYRNPPVPKSCRPQTLNQKRCIFGINRPCNGFAYPPE